MNENLHQRTFILKARLKPLAKKPPNGAIMDANNPYAKACFCTGNVVHSCHGNCRHEKEFIQAMVLIHQGPALAT
jgi:hypothetical protein